MAEGILQLLEKGHVGNSENLSPILVPPHIQCHNSIHDIIWLIVHVSHCESVLQMVAPRDLGASVGFLLQMGESATSLIPDVLVILNPCSRRNLD